MIWELKTKFSVSCDAMPCCQKDTNVLEGGDNRLFRKLCSFTRFVIVVVFYEITIVECVYKKREERKLRVFENMVLRRIFGPRRDEVTG